MTQNQPQAPKIIVEITGEVTLTADQSPPAGAGSAAFTQAITAACPTLKATRINRVTVARPSPTPDTTNGLAWQMSTKTADGEAIAERRFAIYETAAGYELRLGTSAIAVLVSPERGNVEEIGQAWQDGLLTLVAPQARRRA